MKGEMEMVENKEEIGMRRVMPRTTLRVSEYSLTSRTTPVDVFLLLHFVLRTRIRIIKLVS